MRTIAPPARRNTSERGIVLVASLLFVLLTSVLVLVLMLTTTGERTQSSNTQTAKLALYAADAGVRTQQQLLANFAKVKVDSCLAQWVAGGSQPTQPIVINPSQLFPAGVLGSPNAASSANPSFSASASINFSDAAVGPTSQTFNYLFTIQSNGSVGATGKRNVQSTGVLRVSASRGSFSDYLLLTDQFKMANNGTVYFTSADNFDGRVHTNDSFKFAFNPTFQDRVTQVGANATYYNNGSPVTVDANNNGAIDAPNFFGGYVRTQPAIALPTNANDQQMFSLGAPLNNGAPPTSTQINTLLGSPGSTAPPGGYLVNSGGTVSGGIYVVGTANQFRMYADTVTDRQYYQIGVGSSHISIEVDPAANQTRVWNSMGMGGLPDNIYTGLPNGVIYASGGISNLTGGNRDVVTGNINPALALKQQVLIASPGDIVIQSDLTCDEYDAKTNVLGLFSSGGAVRIGNTAPNNLSLDAFVMACGTTTGEFRVDGYNSGGPRGAVNLRGGITSEFYGAFYTWDVNGNPLTGYTRNFHYDRRGLIPPMYPATSIFQADVPSARTLVWKEI